jgi:RimJ/RimL family protein N-acetyltransferase
MAYMITDHWPLFGLRVTTPRLELRVPSLEDITSLAEAASRGVHEPDAMPFNVPWTQAPSPRRERNTYQHIWGHWAAWTPEKWDLALVIVLDGTVIGRQDVSGSRFAITREVSSGSWIELAHQGKGLGTEMRAAMLHLAFAGLGAEWAVSAAFLDNPASRAVSAKLGYTEDGIQIHPDPALGPRPQQRFRLSRADWDKHRTVDAEIHGLDACRDMFGV